MTDHRLRLSPSGPFVGDPALNVGPGMAGRVYRKHGTATTAISVPAGSQAEIIGLSKTAPVLVDFQPNYLYEVKLDTEVKADTLTTEGSFYAYYSLRNAASGVWGAWVKMTDGVYYKHNVGVGTPGQVVGSYHFADDVIDLAVTATCNAVAFAVEATVANQLEIKTGHCFARVEEYTAPPVTP